MADTEATTASDPILALLDEARRHWTRTDPVMAGLARAYPPEPHDMVEEDAFVALSSSIIHQQVSIQAGRTIWRRFEEAVGGTVTPDAVLKTGEDALGAAGVSRQKRGYILDLATRFVSGEVDPSRFPALTDEEIVDELTRVKGIGAWTAKMFLMFHLARPDVVAPEDLGLRLAVARFYDVPESEAARAMRQKAAAWSPYNTVAARVLWHARRAAGDGGGGP